MKERLQKVREASVVVRDTFLAYESAHSSKGGHFFDDDLSKLAAKRATLARESLALIDTILAELDSEKTIEKIMLSMSEVRYDEETL